MAAEPVWIAVDSPAAEPGSVEGASGWVEIQGRVGTGVQRSLDVLLAIDLSGSTLLASGVDVDGDGKVGRVRGRARRQLDHGVTALRLDARHFSSDPEDSVRHAEMLAARRFLSGLDSHRTRVAILAFTETAELVSPLATPAEARAALDALEQEQLLRRGQTNLAAALDLARSALSSEPDAASRDRAIVLLTDGEPSYPFPESKARGEALRAAGEVAREGIRLHALALGGDADLEMAQALTEPSGGLLLTTEEPGEILLTLPRAPLHRIEALAIRNLTTGEPARALRLLADGSFDGFVALVPGANRVLVVARSATSEPTSVERTLHYTPTTAPDDDLLELLADRTAEIEAWQQLERGRSLGESSQDLVLEADPNVP
ncbi:MAG: VWA domain-containing protein [Myxococcota bacterium]|nr:VWA domain-containing protein [Myxococcota bacterium]